MKRSVIICAAAVCSCLLGGGLHAGVITLAPGNGVSTNVTERIVGANDVVVNEGATGGGIVTLANSYNSYTGATTLNCGTLVATALGGDAGSSLGLSSGLTLPRRRRLRPARPQASATPARTADTFPSPSRAPSSPLAPSPPSSTCRATLS